MLKSKEFIVLFCIYISSHSFTKLVKIIEQFPIHVTQVTIYNSILETMLLGVWLVQSRFKYCVSFPNQPLSIQLFVIIIEKGVKGFTLLTVIPLAYASYNIWQGPRYPRCNQVRQFQIGTSWPPTSQPVWPKPSEERTNFHLVTSQTCVLTYSCNCETLNITQRTLYSIYICV